MAALGWLILLMALAAAYFFLMSRAMTSLQVRSVGLIPIEDLRRIYDYRDFFSLVNRSAQGNRKRGPGMGQGRFNKFFTAGPYHFLMAFANLTEVQRDKFANDSSLLKNLVSLFGKYNNAYFAENGAEITSAIANYYRDVEGIGRTSNLSYFITKDFSDLLEQVKQSLDQENIFKAHFFLAGRNESNTDLTDLEFLVLKFLMGRLQANFQGKEYRLEENDNGAQIEDLSKIVGYIITKLNEPDSILAAIPPPVSATNN